MKKIILASTFIACSFLSYSQDLSLDRWEDSGNETNIFIPALGKLNVVKSPEFGTLEEIAKYKIGDATTDYFGVRNGTSLDKKFIPWLQGYNETDKRVSLIFSGITNYTNDDIGGGPIVRFDARKYFDGSLSDGGSKIQNRPLFSWWSYTTPYMTMGPTGFLGIGTESPTAQLHTTSTVRFSGLQNAKSTKILMADNDGLLSSFATDSFIVKGSALKNRVLKLGTGNAIANSIIQDDGTNIGLGGPPTTNGVVTVYGTLHLMSDERTKTNIIPIANALEKVDQLNGYYYDWKEKTGQTQVGLLAQEVEKVLPELVTENTSGTKFLNYDGIIPVLTEAIKAQQKLIVEQGIQLELLKKEVESIKRKNK